MAFRSHPWWLLANRVIASDGLALSMFDKLSKYLGCTPNPSLAVTKRKKERKKEEKKKEEKKKKEKKKEEKKKEEKKKEEKKKEEKK